MKIGYARVSTEDQNLRMQQDTLQKAGCQKSYQEKISGAQVKRGALEELLKNIRLVEGVHGNEHLFISLMKTFSP